MDPFAGLISRRSQGARYRGPGAQIQEAQGRDHRRGEVAAAQPGAHRFPGRAALHINKRLVGFEGRMMRLAKSHGVSREDFLKNYIGSELDAAMTVTPRAGSTSS